VLDDPPDALRRRTGDVGARSYAAAMLNGTLLAESLRVGAELTLPGLRLTRVSRADVSASARSTQPSVWTFLEFEAEDELAAPLAEALAGVLLAEGGWYGDFRVADDHVVVFAGRIFRVPPRRCGRSRRGRRVRRERGCARAPAGLGRLTESARRCPRPIGPVAGITSDTQ
jgi:hypothetical protein